MRVALIGLGMVSRTYADALANTDKAELGPVYGRSVSGRRKFLSDWPGLGGTEATSVQEIADDPTVDFVILATPPNARREIVEILAAAGKPILMEKPVERSLQNAEALVELCEDLDVPLGIVLQHRARPVAALLREKLDTLGHLVAVEVNVPWWRPQTYYNEPGRGTYERDGGGVLISQAIHTMDLMLTFTGPVSEVTAMCATTSAHDMEAEDFVTAGLAFSNGAVGQLFATTASYPGAGETITLHCRDGSARLEAGVLRIDWHDGRTEELGEATASGAGADPMAFTSDWHRFLIEDFSDAITSNRPPLVTGRDALEVHALIAAIEMAGQSGQRIALNDAHHG